MPNKVLYGFYNKALHEEIEETELKDLNFSIPLNDEDYYRQAVGKLKPGFFVLELEKTYNLNSVFNESKSFNDHFPLLSLRKRFRLYAKLVSFFSFILISSKSFKLLVFFIIFLNTLVIIMEKNTIDLERSFFVFFYFEWFLKILAMGLFSQGRGFCYSGYNILDFVINISYLFTSFSPDLNYMDFSAFRTIRLLDIIPSLKLQHILQSIISSFLLLSEIMILLLSFLICYSLIGLHLFYGLLKNRCLMLQTGLPNSDASFCGNVLCGNGEFCGKVPFNPDLDLTSFDDMFHSFLQVFRFFTLSDWTASMYLLQRTYSNFVWIYPFGVIFFGNYFLLNLMFAVLKVKFTENQKKFKEMGLIKEKEANPRFDYRQMVNEKAYKPRKGTYREKSFRDKTSLNSKIFPENPKRSFGNHPQYLNTTLNPIETINERRLLDGIYKYYEKFKENIRNFSRSRLSESMEMQNKENYLEVRVKEELEYKSSSEEDVILFKAFKGNIWKNLKKGSFMRGSIDFKHEIDRIRKKWENHKYNFSDHKILTMTTKRATVHAKKSLVSHARPTNNRISTYINNTMKNRKSRSSMNPNSPGRVFHGRKERTQEKSPVLASKYQLNEIIRKKILDPLIKEDYEFSMENDNEDQDYLTILNKDKKLGCKEEHIWSGEEVLYRRNFQAKKLLNTLKSLSRIKKNIWQISFQGYVGFIQSIARSICHSKLFFIFNCVTICLQTVDLALEGIIDENINDQIFDFCSLYNLGEILMKLLGFSFNRLFRDQLLIIDVLSFTYFLLKSLITSMNLDNSNLRFLKTIVLLRNIRLFSLISYMKTILFVIRHTWLSILNVALILFLMLFTFALFGLQMFGHRIHSYSGQRFIYFDNLIQSFLSVFDLITFDNWYTLIIDGVQNDCTYSITIFILSAIIFGSFVLLNLFMAIVLEGFEYISAFVEPKSDSKSIVLNANLSKNTLVNNNNIENGISINTQGANSYSSPAKFQKNNNRFSSFVDPIIRIGFRKFAMILNEKDRSLGLFSKSSVFRRFCTRMISHKGFQLSIFVINLLHLALMAYETFQPDISFYHGVIKPSNTPNWSENVSKFQFIALICINICWAIEIAAKIVKEGFLLNETAFMKNFYNFMDFFIVLVHFLDWFMTFPWIYQYIGFFRLMKTFKLLESNSYIPLLFKTLLSSFSKFLNVLLVVLLAWLIFGILGIILFKNQLNYCIIDNGNGNILDRLGINQSQCEAQGNYWTINILNFENINSAMLTLLAIGSYDNWFDILQACVNANPPDKGPALFQTLNATFFYFISFIIVGVWFFVGLLNGVIFSIFFKAQKQHLHKFLDENQMKWIEISKIILKTQPSNYFIPNKGLISHCYILKKSQLFSKLKFLILLMNSIVLCLFSDSNANEYYTKYQVFYFIATTFYIMELLLNIFIYKLTNYLGKHYWHNLLALICFIYLLNSIIIFFPTLEILNKQSPLYRFFRFLLSLSIIRLFKRFKSLKKLFSFLYFSLPMISNLIFLLFIIFFVYAVLGCRWFWQFRSGQVLDDYLNFKDFFYALMTMFRTGTANDWNSLMFDVVGNENDNQINKVRDYLFFVSFMLITFFFLINLFTLTLTKEFEDFYLNINSPMQLYKDNLKRFRTLWSTFCLKESLMVIRVEKLAIFFRKMGPPLGGEKFENDLEIGKKLMNLQLRDEGKGLIHFNELLYMTMRLFFRDILKKNENPQAMIELKRNDEYVFQQLDFRKNCLEVFNSSEKLHSKHKGIIHRGMRMNELEMERYMNMNALKKNYINPLYEFFINILLIKTWKRYTIEKLQKFQHFDSNSDDEE